MGVGETVPRTYKTLLVGNDHACWIDGTGASGGEVVSDSDDLLYAVPIIGASDIQQFSTGAVRSSSAGRGRWDLIPFDGLMPLAQRFEHGVPLYGANNWQKGMPLSSLLSSARRHMMQVNYDFSEDHVGAVQWNMVVFAAIVERIKNGTLPKELDDIGYLEKTK